MSRLILILGDQLSPELSALREATKDDLIVMAEVRAEGTYVQHHPKKIALVLSAMRHFADDLRAAGWRVAYTELNDPNNSHTIIGELLRRADVEGTTQVIATQPGEWRLIEALNDAPLTVTQLPDDRFLCSNLEFADWAEGRKELRMEYFYRDMRRKTGLLMEDDKPEGGKWNYDKQNRKPAQVDMFRSGPIEFAPDETTNDVLALVEAEFGDHFGDLHPFRYAVTRGQARRALSHFIENHLPEFGTFQDAMLQQDRTLHHSLLSACMNIGLLHWREVCDAAAQAYADGNAPLNSVEGFIRQIIGWREYIRGIYFLKGPDYARQNKLGHQRKLPALYWGAETRMNCLAHAVRQTKEDAYAHHIQRLMVTGNFALLAGIDPAEVHDWYLQVYVDAFEWVEAPNTLGMSQFADGGLVASKPYVSSGNYIDKMSDYCGACAYDVKAKTGEKACPFNLLYWHFLDRHRDRFKSNHRMGQVYATWDKMDAGRRKTILSEAEAFLMRMSTGEHI